jgi:hypothetical protein
MRARPAERPTVLSDPFAVNRTLPPGTTVPDSASDRRKGDGRPAAPIGRSRATSACSRGRRADELPVGCCRQVLRRDRPRPTRQRAEPFTSSADPIHPVAEKSNVAGGRAVARRDRCDGRGNCPPPGRQVVAVRSPHEEGGRRDGAA